MAHDLEMMIREKVYQVEQSPIAWEKDSAWSRIAHESSRKSRPHFFYYAAASLILATALVFSFEWIRGKQLTQRLESLQLAIDRQLSKPATSSDNSTATEEICASPVAAQISAKEVRQSAQKIERNDLQIMQLPPDEKVESMTMVETTATPVLPLEENAAPIIEPVHAIFGVDVKPTAVAASKKGKKLRIRMFRPDEDSEPFINEREYVNLVARISKK